MRDRDGRGDAPDRTVVGERLFRALTEHSTEAISVIDARGAVRYANPEFCRVFGYGPESALGQRVFDLVHPDDVPAVVAQFEELVRTPGAVRTAEYRARHPGGGWHTRSTVAQNLLADPVVAGVVVNSRDVTEQRRAERALRASEARYRRLVESSHDGICTVDEAGAITFANRRLAEMLGYPMIELAGRSIFDFMAPAAAFEARARFAQRERGLSQTAELPLVRRDGTTLWVRKAATPLFAADGSFAGATYVLGDVTERHHAEGALRESNRLYRLLFDRNPIPMFVADRETRRILAVNDAAVERYGHARDALLAMRLDDLRPPEDRDGFVAAFTAATGYVRAGGIRHVRRDGTSIDVEIVADDVVIAGRGARLVIAHDVTERLRAEAALRDAYREMATLVDAAPLAILTLDRQGRIRSWNATAERMFGWTAEEIIGRENPLIPAEHRARYAQALHELLEGGGRLLEEGWPTLRKDGTLVHAAVSTAPLLDDHGAIVGGVAILADVTTRRKTEAALHEARRQMELLLASAGEGILAVDATGRVTFVNPAATRILGRGPERLLGQELHALVHHTRPDGTPYDADDCPVHAAIRDGAVRRVDADVSWRDDGTSFPVEYVSTPIREGSRIVGAVVAFQDITHRRQLENQLRQAQKMEAIGRLAGGVAHDFNNLLTVITGYTGMLLSELPPTDPIVPDLREIQAASERAGALTRQLLAFSRQQVLDPRVIDLRRVVADTERMLRRLIGEDVELTISGGTAPARVHADPGQIAQVVMNLVVNSRDAMPVGGRIEIEIAEASLTAADAERHPYVTPGDYVRLVVRDTGCGMDERTCARIFDPFFTTKEPGKGTGLGLATVYGIVKQSGGYIWVDSAPGEGATFRIYLPRVTEEEEVVGADVPEIPAPEPHGATVLVAEDEGALRAIIERILKKLGYVVLAAGGGPEALALAARHPGPIDLLVTDVVMPQMSGQELAERLAAVRGDVPVLFLTGYSMEAVTNHGVLRPGSHLLKKPFSPQELAAGVRDLLRAHAGLALTGEHAALDTSGASGSGRRR